MDPERKRQLRHDEACPQREDAGLQCECEYINAEHRRSYTLTLTPMPEAYLETLDAVSAAYARAPGLWALLARAEKENADPGDVAAVNAIKASIGLDAYAILRQAHPFALRKLVGEARRARLHMQEQHDGLDLTDDQAAAADQQASATEARARLMEMLRYGADEDVWPSGMDYRMAAARLIEKHEHECENKAQIRSLIEHIRDEEAKDMTGVETLDYLLKILATNW